MSNVCIHAIHICCTDDGGSGDFAAGYDVDEMGFVFDVTFVITS